MEDKTFELKLQISELEKLIGDKQNELKDTITKLHKTCTHDIAEVENINDYDRNRYEVVCINCGKVLTYSGIFTLKRFMESYHGKLIGNVPNLD